MNLLSVPTHTYVHIDTYEAPCLVFPLYTHPDTLHTPRHYMSTVQRLVAFHNHATHNINNTWGREPRHGRTNV